MPLTRTFSKSKLNLKSDRVIVVAPTIPIKCLLYLPNVRGIQYKLGPERLTRLQLPVQTLFKIVITILFLCNCRKENIEHLLR